MIALAFTITIRMCANSTTSLQCHLKDMFVIRITVNPHLADVTVCGILMSSSTDMKSSSAGTVVSASLSESDSKSGRSRSVSSDFCRENSSLVGKVLCWTNGLMCKSFVSFSGY